MTMGRLFANEFRLLSRSVLARTFFLLAVWPGRGRGEFSSVLQSDGTARDDPKKFLSQTSLGSARSPPLWAGLLSLPC